VAVLGDGTCVDCSCLDAALQRAWRKQIVSSHVDLVAAHKASHLQVQTEGLTQPVCVHAHRGHQTFCRALVVDQVAAVTGYACRVVQPAAGVEFDNAVGLEVDALCVIAGEDAEGLVESVGVAGEGEREVRQVVCVDLGLEGVSFSRLRKAASSLGASFLLCMCPST